MLTPSQNKLENTLNDAVSAHHEYEQVTLDGNRDELWAGFYAAYTLGRIGDFATPSKLSQWLEEAPAGEDWATNTAMYILSHLEGE